MVATQITIEASEYTHPAHMNVLIACEESQRSCIAFREHGHNAFSCDILPCSGGHPEWHIQGDVLPLLNGDCVFSTSTHTHTQDGPWDLIIAHPPCTYLSNCATRQHSARCNPLERINDRTMKRILAAEFFMRFVTARCERIAIENPVGIMNTLYRAPDQIIDPYMFCTFEDSEDYVTKRTCLWLKGLPPLVAYNNLRPDNNSVYGRNPNGKVSCWTERVSTNRASERSKTFWSVARAFAEQWG